MDQHSLCSYACAFLFRQNKDTAISWRMVYRFFLKKYLNEFILLFFKVVKLIFEYSVSMPLNRK